MSVWEWCQLGDKLRASEAKPAVWKVTLVLGIVLVNFWVLGLRTMANWEPWGNNDEPSYVDLAQRIARGDGFTATGPERCHLSLGLIEHIETNRQPLAPYLWSLFADDSRATAVRLRLFNLGLGCVLIVLVVVLGHRLWGWRGSLGAAALLSVSCLMLDMSAAVMVEPLLGIWFLIFLVSAVAATCSGRWWTWAVSGAAAGLGWLTKGSALLWLPALAVAAAYAGGKWQRRLGGLLLAFAMFVIVAMPLMARNLRLYGNPLYSLPGVLMWMDAWEEPGGGTAYWYEPDQVPTLGKYLRTHSLSQMAKREGAGLLWNLNWLAQTMAIRVPRIHDIRRTIVGAPLLLLGLIGLVGQRRRAVAALTGSVLLLMWLSLAWYYVIGPSHRLWFVASVMLFGYAGCFIAGLVWATGGALGRVSNFRNSVIALVVVLAIGQAYAWRAKVPSPFVPPAYSEADKAIDDWTAANIAADEPVWGKWPASVDTTILTYHTLAEFNERARHYGVRWLVISDIQYGRRLWLFEEYISLTSDRGLQLRKPLPGWELVFKAADGAYVRYLVFARTPHDT